jgi:hypothetical protein
VTGLAAASVVALAYAPQQGGGRLAAYTVSTHTDGTVHVTWDEAEYFSNHAGLEKALRKAGFPVVIKEGTFCVGAGDDTSLDLNGTGPGVSSVVSVKGDGTGRDKAGVTFVYNPAAMPAGKQLFIGYLNRAQLAVTHGRPGSVERIVSTGALTCTAQAPPPGPAKGPAEAPKATENKY